MNTDFESRYANFASKLFTFSAFYCAQSVTRPPFSEARLCRRPAAAVWPVLRLAFSTVALQFLLRLWLQILIRVNPWFKLRLEQPHLLAARAAKIRRGKGVSAFAQAVPAQRDFEQLA